MTPLMYRTSFRAPTFQNFGHWTFPPLPVPNDHFGRFSTFWRFFRLGMWNLSMEASRAPSEYVFMLLGLTENEQIDPSIEFSHEIFFRSILVHPPLFPTLLSQAPMRKNPPKSQNSTKNNLVRKLSPGIHFSRKSKY